MDGPCKIGEAIELDFHALLRGIVRAEMRGGMGVVYQIIPLKPDSRPLALKTFQIGLPPGQFDHEARVWAALSSHENVAAFLGYGVWRQQPCILSVWYPQTLQELRPDTLSPAKLEVVFRGILSGLCHAEQAGVVHQDVKPNNIFIELDGTPRIADFGLARITRSPDARAAGTPYFMAPELLAGLGPASSCTDIFSLGVSLYQWFTGEHPYWTSGARAPRPAAFPRAKLQSAAAGHAWIVPVVEAMCSWDPRGRPQRFVDLAAPGKGTRSRATERGQADTVIALAATLRKQGRRPEAFHMLMAEVKSRPTPELWNAIAVIYLEERDRVSHKQALMQAASMLIESGGRLANGRYYVDPLINLFRVYYGESDFKQAFSILSASHDWASRAAEEGAEKYQEFGWMMMYAGAYEDALYYLHGCLAHAGPDAPSREWMTLAAFLSGRLDPWAPVIAHAFLASPSFHPLGPACAVVVGGHDPSTQRQIFEMHGEAARAEYQRILGRQAGPRPPFSLPLSPLAEGLVVSFTSHVLTGGVCRPTS